MDADRFAALLRSLSTMPSRRWVVRSLAGLVLGGALGPLGVAEAEQRREKREKKRKKKRRRNRTPPFCAGKNLCTDGGDSTRCESSNATDACFCVVDSKTGEPFCAQNGFGTPADCSGCSEGDICMDCNPGFFCAQPCANPR